MDIINNNISLHLICLLFEEYAPYIPYIMATIMPFILLLFVANYEGNKNDDYSITTRNQDCLTTTQDIQILNTAYKYHIYWDNLTTNRMLLQNLENELEKVTVHSDPFDQAENMRIAFLSGMKMKEKDAKKSPIRNLFHNGYKNQQNGCESKIVVKIFEFAGISINKINEDYKKIQRTAFESGAHQKNDLILTYPNNVQIPHPLFSFFCRLNRNRVQRPRNLNQRLPFQIQKLTNLKKFTEQGGKAYDKRKILRNIYEFAGIIPKSKQKR